MGGNRVINLNCVICHTDYEEDDTDVDSGDLKQGFSLFCKLLNVTTSSKYSELFKVISTARVSSPDDDEVRERVVPVSACEFCAVGFQEIFRLDRKIKNLQISQMEHVNSLRRLLLRSERTSNDEENLSSNFWERATTQLFNCLRKQAVQPPEGWSSENQSRKRVMNFSSESCSERGRIPTAKRSRPFNHLSTNKYKMLLKPCSVKLTRLGINRYDFGKNAPLTSKESFLVLPKMEPDDEDDNVSHVEFCDSGNIMKQEVEMEEEVSTTSRLNSTTATSTTPDLPTPKSRDNIMLFQENLYAYRSTIVRFSSEDRHHICLEPNCHYQFKGSIVNGTLFNNIRGHVRAEHNVQVAGSRACVLCSQKCSGPVQLRSHLITKHNTVVFGRSKPKTLVICLTCGKPCVDSFHLLHLWEHKSVEEQIAAIKAGEIVPSKLRIKVGNKVKHPLYPFLYDPDGNRKFFKSNYGSPGTSGTATTITPVDTTSPNSSLLSTSPARTTRTSSSRLSRQSKLKACKIIKQTAEKVQMQEKDQSRKTAKHALKKEKQWGQRISDDDECDLPSDADIKQEDVVEQELESEWSPNNTKNTAAKRKKSQAVMKFVNPPPNHQPIESGVQMNYTLQLIQENVYIFKYTVIKFCPTERHFICQEPNCNVRILGSVQGGSIFENICTHVTTNHIMAVTNQLLRCIFCSEKHQGSRALKKHLVTKHSKTAEYASPKLMVICQFCGKCCYDSDIFQHAWTHKSFYEQVATIKMGKGVPFKVLNAVKRNSNHPLYSLLFGPNKNVNNGVDNNDETVTLLTQDPSHKFNLNTVYHQQEDNVLLYRNAVFRYVPEERTFQCLEVECGYTVPEWKSCVVSKIQTHCQLEHIWALDKDGADENEMRKTCPLCAETITKGLIQFRTHMVENHLKGTTTALCEVCSKPLGLEDDYLTHLWTHKNDEDRDTATQTGAPVPAFWKNMKKNVTRRRQKVNGPPGSQDNVTVNQFLYYVNKSTVLFKGTLLSIEDHGSKLLCRGPECGETFVGDPMNFVGLFSQIKAHIEEYHQRHYSLCTSAVECPVCAGQFYGGSQLRNHIIKEHKGSCGHRGGGPNAGKPMGSRWTVCEICLKPVKYSFNRVYGHSWSHMNELEKYEDAAYGPRRPGEKLPDINLSTEELLKIRMTELDLVTLSCEICGMTFSKKYYLKLHLKIHAVKRKTWSCSKCGKKFLSSTAVRFHNERFHQPELKQVVACTVPGCSRIFNRRSITQFRDHLRWHKGEKPWVCDICGKGFHSNSLFRSHQKTIHLDERVSYQCEQCGKSYAYKKHLIRHTKKQHESSM